MESKFNDILSHAASFATEASRLSQKLIEKTKEYGGLKNYYDSTEHDIEKDLDSSVSDSNLVRAG
jgi:hypothetical protein